MSSDLATSARMKQRRFLLLMAVMFPMLYFLYSAIWMEQPYHLSGIFNYYYNGRLVYEGLPFGGVTHPGTSIYYLGGLILLVTGLNPDLRQKCGCSQRK